MNESNSYDTSNKQLIDIIELNNEINIFFKDAICHFEQQITKSLGKENSILIHNFSNIEKRFRSDSYGGKIDRYIINFNLSINLKKQSILYEEGISMDWETKKDNKYNLEDVIVKYGSRNFKLKDKIQNEYNDFFDALIKYFKGEISKKNNNIPWG